MHLEDNELDRELVRRALDVEGLEVEFTYAATREEFVQALKAGNLDLVLSDFTLPGYGGAAALEHVRAQFPELPFIFVSGTIGEKRAIECLRNGATDYVLKDDPHRLAPATRRALREAKESKRRREAEEALQQERERFAAIFQFSPVGIGLGLGEGRMVNVNPQLCEIFGYSREELLGRSVQELNIWAEPEQREAALAKLHTEKAVRNFEAKFRRKSGEIRIGLLAIETLQLGVEPLLLATVVDITERKVLEGELLRANRVQSVGRLASGIAHDLNNILAPIMMSAPLLRMNLGPVDTEKTLATIELSAARGADLVRRLLTFGRGVEGDRGPVRVAGLIQEVVKIAGETFPKKILLRSRVAADTWAVRGDASQLHQVVLNLFVNARDAMPSGGTLTVEAKNVQLDENFTVAHPGMQPGDFVRLSVTDSGTGIPPQIVDKIFDPFFTTKAVGQGTGLGLSTVLGIVKSHEGLITVRSEENSGTTFEIYLPAIAAEAETVAAPASEPPRGNHELVLVVDDEPHIRAVVQKALSTHGYRVLVASDGAEASAMFARNISEITLVITDLDMPYMNGLSLARTLQRMKPDIKILVSSGLGSTKNARQWGSELAALGIPPILPKPYSIETLLTMVHRLLSEPDEREMRVASA